MNMIIVAILALRFLIKLRFLYFLEVTLSWIHPIHQNLCRSQWPRVGSNIDSRDDRFVYGYVTLPLYGVEHDSCYLCKILVTLKTYVTLAIAQ